MQLLEREISDSIWLLMPFFMLLIFYAFQNKKKQKFYTATIKGVLDFQHFRLTYKNEENKSKIDVLVIVSLLLISLYIKSLGFFIVYSEQQILLDYLIFVLLISAYFFTKTLLIRLTGYLFDFKYLINVYLIYYKYYIKAIALIAIPFLAINLISDKVELLSTANVIFLTTVFLLLIFRLFHIVTKGVENKVSYLNIFLYLCTLEISPLVFLYYIFGEN